MAPAATNSTATFSVARPPPRGPCHLLGRDVATGGAGVAPSRPVETDFRRDHASIPAGGPTDSDSARGQLRTGDVAPEAAEQLRSGRAAALRQPWARPGALVPLEVTSRCRRPPDRGSPATRPPPAAARRRRSGSR